MLEVKNVFSGYGKLEVLHGVSMLAKEKEITGIIGPNGCGKSTLLKTIIGFLRPKEGQVIFYGKDITGLRPDKALMEGISMIPQGRGVFPNMTVFENLKMGAYVIKDADLIKERFEMVYNEFPLLKERKKLLASELSGGEQTILCFGRALMLRPKLILMDEPSVGLAPKVIASVYKKIEEINDGGIPIVIVEQNVRKILSVADHTYVLELGKNRFEGTSKTILNDADIVKLYLGSAKQAPS